MNRIRKKTQRLQTKVKAIIKIQASRVNRVIIKIVKIVKQSLT